MVRFFVFVRMMADDIGSQLRRLCQADAGQATAEYALVLLGVAAIALLVAAWATKSGAIGQLFDAVIGKLISKAR
jgi:Flp pilus assembly pilin Flp